MSDDEQYTCPDCGKVYPVMPKWCPCTPFPMADPYTAYFLIELVPGAELDEFVSGGYESVTSLLAGEANPFKTVSMVYQGTGWEGSFIPFPGEEEGPGEPETLLDWLEHYLEKGEVRGSPNGSATNLVLLKESFRPGVETLDYLGWDVVDLEKEDYDRLLSMAGVGACNGA